MVVDIEPSVGTTRGGAEITLKGRNFRQHTIVEIGDEEVDVTFESETRLRVITPPRRAPGPVGVHVLNPSGLAHRLPDAFLYRLPPPRIDSVSPAEGPNAGGTRVTVRGADFQEGCDVIVCGVPVKASFLGPDTLELVTPPVSRDGGADVRVVNPDDQSHTAERAFRYIAPLPPPVLTQISPTQGTQAGGLRIALYGEDFAEGVFVRIGGAAADTTFLTRKEIAAITPARRSGGPVDVEVVNPDGERSRLEAAFTYEELPAPAITSASPTNGPTTGGTRVIIEGVNFAKGATVYIGREPPKEMVVKSATEIHIVVPPRKQPGVVDHEVMMPGVPKAVMKSAFRYDAQPAPSITSVSPTRGGTAGGTELTITGTGFLRETAVLIDGKPVKLVKLVDKSTLEVKTPPGADNKLVDVVVRNPDGKEAVQKRAFMYDPRYR
ncbi:MAG: IPT/TIG domain-containing protein [Polyangiaceae bacterium]|nr:IPT/TIG domain-containing protein [Polyangiaceae bacterium]